VPEFFMPSTLPKHLSSFTNKPAVWRSLLGLGAFLLLFGLFGYFLLPDSLGQPGTLT